MQIQTTQGKNMTTQNIAIDIGYGDTKVMFNGKCFKFPSAIEQIRQAQASLAGNELDVYSLNGVKFKVGQKATINAIATRGFGFLQKYSPLLIRHAFSLANIDLDKPISLATGLSILNYQEAQSFLASISKFIIDDKVFELDVSLFAQGQGVFIEYPEQKDEKLICIIDIGYNTLDFLAFEDNEPRNDLCFANQGGANKIIVDLQKLLSREYKIDFSEQQAKKIFMSKEVQISGQVIDFSDIINEMTTQYADFVMDEFYNKIGDTIKLADKVIISGGGAYFLDKEYMQKEYPHIFFTQNPYEFSNVRGYYKGAFESDNELEIKKGNNDA